MKKEERRSGKQQRWRKDRRKFNNPKCKSPERRSGRDRRSGKDRRKST